MKILKLQGLESFLLVNISMQWEGGTPTTPLGMKFLTLEHFETPPIHLYICLL
jgi:hypothetical protein